MIARKKGKWRDRMFKSTWLGQMGKCEHCGEKESNTPGFELDHIKPLCEGGTNDSENLQLLCTACHKIKTASEVTARAKQRRIELGRKVLRVPA